MKNKNSPLKEILDEAIINCKHLKDLFDLLDNIIDDFANLQKNTTSHTRVVGFLRIVKIFGESSVLGIDKNLSTLWHIL